MEPVFGAYLTAFNCSSLVCLKTIDPWKIMHPNIDIGVRKKKEKKVSVSMNYVLNIRDLKEVRGLFVNVLAYISCS